MSRPSMPMGPHPALATPWFDDRHRDFAQRLDAWCREALAAVPGAGDERRDAVDERCRALVRTLGRGGWLRHAVAGRADGGAADAIDTRCLCLARETLAWHDGLADFAFAMQGLGSGAIGLAGSAEQRGRWLAAVAAGDAIAAFALSEPDAGSDVAAMGCAAWQDGDVIRLDGDKTWISNGGIADVYVVFAREVDAAAGRSTHRDLIRGTRGTRDISAFIVPADTPGLVIAERIDVIAPHPLARLHFDGARLPAAARLGAAGHGFKLAMRTLDIFRTSVAAAALGFGRRALDEALAHSRSRPMFGQMLADLPLARAKLADMATTMEAASLLTYRAAWQRDHSNAVMKTVTQAAAMAKMAATEGAQQVIDAAVQLFGGRGVRHGEVVEHLYREIRALRIYEGATEVQKLIIARELLEAAAAAAADSTATASGR
jgi:acyl-CoA dehydrogenase